jgi:O-antigen ligase
MNLESTQIFQLIGALLGALIVFVAANSAPLKVSIGILLIFIPFQPIETPRLGSANIIMTYVLFGALLLRGRIRYLPMLWAILLVVFAYLLSISQLNRALYVDHGLQLFFLVSGFLVMILTYNLVREARDSRLIVNLFIGVNILVLIYCLVQLSVGPGERMYFFGSEHLWMHRNRGGGDPRLVGPFGTTGCTAAYLMSMTVILAYEILHSRGWRRNLLLGIVAANLGMMIATGNRSSFILLIGSMLWFLYLFRAELGFVRIVQALTASAVVLVGAAFFIVNYTGFNVMFDRLEDTHFVEGGIPDTRRVVWPRAWAAFEEKPWLGHGPNLEQERVLRYRNVHRDQLLMNYPHSLYLYLLVTVGIVGTLAFLLFFIAAAARVLRSASTGNFASEYERGWVLVGSIVLVAFFLDQIKIEFLRGGTTDFAHFIFAIFGWFIGCADEARARARGTRDEQERPKYSPLDPVARTGL